MEIYVGNVHKNVTKEELQAKFEKFGQVASVKLKKDLFTGQNKGYAFVLMPVQSEAKAAIKALNGKKMEGRVIKVTAGRPQERDWNKGVRKGKPF
jgi:RNA recognition motif-containing protein